MGVLRDVWQVLSADAFWGHVREVRWTRTDEGDRARLTVHNPSKHSIEMVAVILREPPADGPHGHWRPAERLVLTARRGEPTVLDHPVLRPAEQVRIRSGADLTLDLPGTVPPGSVDAVVLTGLFEGQAVKQWRLGEQGVVDVLRDDKVPLTAGDGLRGLLDVLSGQR